MILVVSKFKRFPSICLMIFGFQANAYMDLDIISCEQMAGDSRIIDWRDLKIKRFNRTTRGLFGKVTYHKALDKNFTLEIIVLMKQGGQYRQLPYRIPPKIFCTFVQEDSYIYPEVASVSDFPYPPSCPFPNVNVYLVSLFGNFIKFCFRELLR